MSMLKQVLVSGHHVDATFIGSILELGFCGHLVLATRSIICTVRSSSYPPYSISKQCVFENYFRTMMSRNDATTNLLEIRNDITGSLFWRNKGGRGRYACYSIGWGGDIGTVKMCPFFCRAWPLEAPCGHVSATLSLSRVPFSSPIQCEPVFGTRRSCLVSLWLKRNLLFFCLPNLQLTSYPTTVLLQSTVKTFLGDSFFEKRIEILHQKWIVCDALDHVWTTFLPLPPRCF